MFHVEWTRFSKQWKLTLWYTLHVNQIYFLGKALIDIVLATNKNMNVGVCCPDLWFYAVFRVDGLHTIQYNDGFTFLCLLTGSEIHEVNDWCAANYVGICILERNNVRWYNEIHMKSITISSNVLTSRPLIQTCLITMTLTVTARNHNIYDLNFWTSSGHHHRSSGCVYSTQGNTRKGKPMQWT